MGRAGTRVPGADERSLASILHAASYGERYYGLGADDALWISYVRPGGEACDIAYLSERGDLVLAYRKPAKVSQERRYHADTLKELVEEHEGASHASESVRYGQDALAALAPQVQPSYHLPAESSRLLAAVRAAPLYEAPQGMRLLTPKSA